MNSVRFSILLTFVVILTTRGIAQADTLNTSTTSKTLKIKGTLQTSIANYYSRSVAVSSPLLGTDNKKCTSTPKLISLSVQGSRTIPCRCVHYRSGAPISCGSPSTYNGSVSASLAALNADSISIFTKKTCTKGYSYSANGSYKVDYEIECESKATTSTKLITSSTLVVPEGIDVSKKNHFKTLWFEPLWHSNYTSYNDVREYLRNIKNMGFERIVIAYSFSDWGQCFLYTPKTNFSFIAYNNTGYNTYTSVTVNSLSPASACPSHEKYKNFLDYFYTASDELGLKIILGLSRTGDVYLLNDIENSINGNTSQMMMPYYNVNSRLGTAISLSKTMAADLYAQYGSRKSFEGWYLTHETNCLDVGANYYDSMSIYLKSLSGKKVMISPTVDAKMCFGGTLLDFATNHKGLIDIYSYQDTVGAGTILVNGYGQYYYTLAARYQRITQLVSSGLLYSLFLTHAQTGTEFQINAEGWEMDGSVGYGNSYGGDWSRIQVQLNAYYPYTQSIMLNEGFLLFQFGQNTLSFDSGTKNAATATKFANDYLNYLKN